MIKISLELDNETSEKIIMGILEAITEFIESKK